MTIVTWRRDERDFTPPATLAAMITKMATMVNFLVIDRTTGDESDENIAQRARRLKLEEGLVVIRIGFGPKSRSDLERAG